MLPLVKKNKRKKMESKIEYNADRITEKLTT
jgi:hypothetical protein